MRTYVSLPETTGKFPGVIVIVETSEVDTYIQEVTGKLAREGHVPVAPVLYHRLGSTHYSATRGKMLTCAPGRWAASKSTPAPTKAFMR